MARLRTFRWSFVAVLAAIVASASARHAWAQAQPVLSGGGFTAPPAALPAEPAVTVESEPVLVEVYTTVSRTSASSASEQAIRAALRNETNINFVSTPLQDVTDFLKEQHQIEIQLDAKALEDGGIGADVPITRSIKGIPLQAALALLLRDLDLTAVITNEVLLITTTKAASEMIELRVYDVADLIDDEEDADDLAALFNVLLYPSRQKPVSPQMAAAKMHIVPYRNLLLARASIVSHERISQLLDEIRAKLDDKD